MTSINLFLVRLLTYAASWRGALDDVLEGPNADGGDGIAPYMVKLALLLGVTLVVVGVIVVAVKALGNKVSNSVNGVTP